MDRYVITASLKEIPPGTRNQWRLSVTINLINSLCTSRWRLDFSYRWLFVPWTIRTTCRPFVPWTIRPIDLSYHLYNLLSLSTSSSTWSSNVVIAVELYSKRNVKVFLANTDLGLRLCSLLNYLSASVQLSWMRSLCNLIQLCSTHTSHLSRSVIPAACLSVATMKE